MTDPARPLTRSPNMVALVTPSGTACCETGLCERHDTPANRAGVEAETCHGRDVGYGEPPVPGSWVDVGGNEAVGCQWCPGEGGDVG